MTEWIKTHSPNMHPTLLNSYQWLRWGVMMVLLCITFGLIAQTPSIDTLNTQLAEHPTQDSVYVDLLNQLSGVYWNIAPKKTDSLAQIAIKLSQKLGYQLGEADALYKKSIGKWMLGTYDEAFEAATSAYKLYDALQLPHGSASCFQMMALIMDDQGRYPLSL